MNKFFRVKVKCGHVGKSNFVLIDYAVCAEDKKQAAAKARKMPRVKHDHKDAIREVEEISYREYKNIKKGYSNINYMTCKNIQEQRNYDNLGVNIYKEDRKKDYKSKKANCKEYKLKRKALREFSNISYNEY